MPCRRFAAALAACAALIVFHAPVEAGKGGGPAASAADAARAEFARDVAAAERVLASATANISAGLRDETTTSLDAATGFEAAFTFFAGQVKKHADEASEALAADLSQAIVSTDDQELAGTLAGDGGALDHFADAMQSSLDAARRRALARARRFARTFARAGNGRQTMFVSLPAWTFERRIAPGVPTAIEPKDEGLALLAVIAARLDDGTVVVAAGGRAAPALSGKFDVRLVGKTVVLAVGPLLAAGGIAVSADGTWTSVAKLNDPQQGEAVDAGNRVVAFGIEPYDGGLAGQQPGRHQHAGVIGIP